MDYDLMLSFLIREEFAERSITEFLAQMTRNIRGCASKLIERGVFFYPHIDEALSAKIRASRLVARDDAEFESLSLGCAPILLLWHGCFGARALLQRGMQPTFLFSAGEAPYSAEDYLLTQLSHPDIDHTVNGKERTVSCRAREMAMMTLVGRVKYTGLFLPERARASLRSYFGQMHPNLYLTHVTLCFKPAAFEVQSVLIGNQVTVKVTGILITKEVSVLTVELPDGYQRESGSRCLNARPHITVSTAEGVAPSQSNVALEEYFSGECDGVFISYICYVTLTVGVSIARDDDGPTKLTTGLAVEEFHKSFHAQKVAAELARKKE